MFSTTTQHHGEDTQVNGPYHERRREDEFETIIGESDSLRYVLSRVEQVSETDATVLLFGETGTGKELLAHAIHKRSRRRDRPFVIVNCAALPASLIESELFGRERGAFTGAHATQVGRFELANRGTLFLDEIGEMSLTIQVKLLRVLERMEFRRLGGTSDISVSVRVVSATNRDLQKEVDEGRFRADLYYRLKVVPMYIPPLRERKEDLLKFVNYFINMFNGKFSKNFTSIADDARQLLLTYPWPGNIRELKNVIERVVLLETGPVMRRDMLPFSNYRPDEGTLGRRLDSILSAPLPEDGIDFEGLVSDVERALILKASEESQWNQSKTARLLNVKRDKLRYRMRSFDINDEEVPTSS
jgi:transcriptional regulator with GAF, ATPase, and Fis domain